MQSAATICLPSANCQSAALYPIPLFVGISEDEAGDYETREFHLAISPCTHTVPLFPQLIPGLAHVKSRV